MSKYEAVYFMGDNQAINSIPVSSFEERNQDTFSGLSAAGIFIKLSG